MSEADNKHQLAKNTLYLYIRMLVLMFIGLFTSRVVLNALGVTDYGINNVVGGIVSMFSIFSGSLVAAISRFLTFELGKNNLEKLNKVFCTSINVLAILYIFVFILLETIGIWYLFNVAVIPHDRLNAAFLVYEFSVIGFGLGLLMVPYNSCLVAHEKMSTFAYMGILDAVFKLLIAYLIYVSPFDKLVTFATLGFVTSVIMQFIYWYYCKKCFSECHYHLIFESKLLKEIFSFAGWNFIGASSALLRDTGGNLVINYFCGPAVNAARGIAETVNGKITQFAGGFMTALQPQIVKSYAAGNYDYMMSIIYQGARFSFYLLFFLSLPIMLNAYYVLWLWLGQVPEHTTNFMILILVFAMSETISNPLVMVMLATGKIRNYQIVVGGLQMLNLPISYIVMRIGASPESVFWVAIIISQSCLAARLYMLRPLIHLNSIDFLRKVYFNIVKVVVIALPIPIITSQLFPRGFLWFGFHCLLCITIVGIVILYIGCNQHEREVIIAKVRSTFLHR